MTVYGYLCGSLWYVVAGAFLGITEIGLSMVWYWRLPLAILLGKIRNYSQGGKKYNHK